MLSACQGGNSDPKGDIFAHVGWACFLGIFNNVAEGSGFACWVFSDLVFTWWSRNCCGDFVASCLVALLVGGFNVGFRTVGEEFGIAPELTLL